MDRELQEKVEPRAREICSLVDQMALTVEKARKAQALDFDTAEDLAALFDRARSRAIDYLHTVGIAEGRRPYLSLVREAG